MTFSDIRCPVCGALPRGTLEVCVATFRMGTDDDEVAWSGTIDTDGSTTLYENGQPVLICENGHSYQHALFTDDYLNELG
jgi:hypothetical protein